MDYKKVRDKIDYVNRKIDYQDIALKRSASRDPRITVGHSKIQKQNRCPFRNLMLIALKNTQGITAKLLPIR
jgi:hypothetical protein